LLAGLHSAHNPQIVESVGNIESEKVVAGPMDGGGCARERSKRCDFIRHLPVVTVVRPCVGQSCVNLLEFDLSDSPAGNQHRSIAACTRPSSCQHSVSILHPPLS